MKNPYIGPDGKDIHSKEELDAILEKIDKEEKDAILAAFYSLSLEQRREILKHYNNVKSDFGVQLEDETINQGKLR